MSKVALVASNLVTAVTAAVTTMVWVGAYGGSDSGTAPRQAQTLAAQPVPKVQVGDLQIGPTGVALPVLGVEPSQLVDTFTQARAGGARIHDAIDIMAPAGTPVVAAAPGVVEKLFFSGGGGGITAYVRSPDGRWSYYYAHLRAYAPGLREGARVRRGDPIGEVGSTGNANPSGPHLHFAIHRMDSGQRWHEGAAINPYPLLAGNGTRS